MSELLDARPDAVAAVASRCPGCGATLAGDERFCLACGLRLAPDELRLAALPLLTAAGTPAAAVAAASRFRRPAARSAAATAVVVLVLGIAIGATIGPAAVGETPAAQRAVVLVDAPAAAPAPAAGDDGSSDPASAGTTASLPPDSDDKDAVVGGEEATAPAAQAPASQPPAVSTPSDAPPPADAPPPGSLALAGTVAAVAADGESFVLAARDGTLLRVHASGCAPAPGDDLHLRARQLANGTWSADRARRVGAGWPVRAVGVVVWSDPATGRYALGARGVTLLVAPPPADAADAADAADPADPADPAAPARTPQPAPARTPQPAPALGAQLRVRLEPLAAHDGQPAALVERARRDVPAPADPAASPPPIELAGAVQATDLRARTLTLALDPDAQPPVAVALSAPPELDLRQLLPPQRVAVAATAQPDGTLVLASVAPEDPDATVATCTPLAAAAPADLQTFTGPPPDRNESPRTRS